MIVNFPADQLAPAVKVTPTYLTVDEGQLAEFHCVLLAGYPTPRLDWSGGPRGVLPIDAVIDGPVLRFQAVSSREHKGEYFCTASNAVGSARAAAFLDVRTGKIVFIYNYYLFLLLVFDLLFLQLLLVFHALLFVVFLKPENW